MLGRWCILNSTNNRKIDLANIDHCGTCSYDEVKESKKKDSITKVVKE